MSIKRIIILAFAVVAFVSCKKDYEKEVDEYYSTHLNDPSSYELVSIDPLQNLTPTSLVTITNESDKDLYSKVKYVREAIKNEGKDPDELLGYYVIHKYRANNAFGAKVKQEDVVFFNKDKKIIDVRKMSDLRKK